ncbi:MAG: YihY/virulence factor BrkB family protein [Clostridia bacterium]|nr:YihY/virulence factor BrkB family protein [Clostridia bacterium]
MKRGYTLYLFVKEKYGVLSEKKYTTIAGTLVFFLIMSLMPLAVWLTLIFGRLDVPLDRLLDQPVFQSVKKVVSFVREQAASASRGVSFVFIATSLYSVTSLFYHMRRSGEIVYEYSRIKSGWRVRVSALVFTFAVMLLSVLSVFVFALGAFLFSKLLSSWAATLLDYLLLLALSFFLVWLLNYYICPYRVLFRELVGGTAITIAAWAVALVGFSVYLKLGNTGKLYGALGVLIVFFLWLYVLMICFVSGVIFNSEKIRARESKRL